MRLPFPTLLGDVLPPPASPKYWPSQYVSVRNVRPSHPTLQHYLDLRLSFKCNEEVHLDLRRGRGTVSIFCEPKCDLHFCIKTGTRCIFTHAKWGFVFHKFISLPLSMWKTAKAGNGKCTWSKFYLNKFSFPVNLWVKISIFELD